MRTVKRTAMILLIAISAVCCGQGAGHPWVLEVMRADGQIQREGGFETEEECEKATAKVVEDRQVIYAHCRDVLADPLDSETPKK